MIKEEFLSGHIIKIEAYRNHPKLFWPLHLKSLTLRLTNTCGWSWQEVLVG